MIVISFIKSSQFRDQIVQRLHKLCLHSLCCTLRLCSLTSIFVTPNPLACTWMNWCVHSIQVLFSGNPQPNQPAVKVRQFYMVKLQCPCPISLWSEPGLNVPILILPNKLNQGIARGAGESHPVRHTSVPPSLPAKRSGHLERRVVNWFRMWEVSDKHPKTHCNEGNQQGRKFSQEGGGGGILS